LQTWLLAAPGSGCQDVLCTVIASALTPAIVHPAINACSRQRFLSTTSAGYPWPSPCGRCDDPEGSTAGPGRVLRVDHCLAVACCNLAYCKCTVSTAIMCAAVYALLCCQPSSGPSHRQLAAKLPMKMVRADMPSTSVKILKGLFCWLPMYHGCSLLEHPSQLKIELVSLSFGGWFITIENCNPTQCFAVWMGVCERLSHGWGCNGGNCACSTHTRECCAPCF
jgi:hypothetical protein